MTMTGTFSFVKNKNENVILKNFAAWYNTIPNHKMVVYSLSAMDILLTENL